MPARPKQGCDMAWRLNTMIITVYLKLRFIHFCISIYFLLFFIIIIKEQKHFITAFILLYICLVIAHGILNRSVIKIRYKIYSYQNDSQVYLPFLYKFHKIYNYLSPTHKNSSFCSFLINCHRHNIKTLKPFKILIIN